MKAATPNLMARVSNIDSTTRSLVQIINSNNEKFLELNTKVLERLSELNTRMCHIEAKVELILSGSRTEMQYGWKDLVALMEKKQSEPH